MKKTLLAGASALALVAFSGGAYADSHDLTVDVDLSDTATGNSGAVSQGQFSDAANGSGAAAQAMSASATAASGSGPASQGSYNNSAQGGGNFNQGAGGGSSEVVQASDGGIAVNNENGEALAFGDGSIAIENGAVGGDNSAVVGENNSGAVAAGSSIALVTSDSANAFNDSLAAEEGGLVGGAGTAVGNDNSGAVATGGGTAINNVDESFNDRFLQAAESEVSLNQTITGVSMMAGGGQGVGGESAAGGGGTLTTGSIASSVADNTGITTVNMNTGIANQGASISIGAVASF